MTYYERVYYGDMEDEYDYEPVIEPLMTAAEWRAAVNYEAHRLALEFLVADALYAAAYGNQQERKNAGQVSPENASRIFDAAVGEDTPIVLDDYERDVLDRALDKMEGIGEDKT